MAVTIKQIAERAGVCRATVDKVLHNRPGVSEEMRNRVQGVIDEMGYKPNIIGQALKRQDRTINIAAVLLSLQSLPYLLQGINQKIREVGDFGVKVTPFVSPYPDIDAQAELLDSISADQYAGVILTPLDAPKIAGCIKRLKDAGLTVITINSDIDSARDCFIGENFHQAGRTSAHLINLLLGGHGYAGVLIGSEHVSFDRKRLEGFQEYMAGCPGIHLADVLTTEEQPERTYLQTKSMLVENPELQCLFITCGCVADAARAVHDMGKSVQIICFDSFPETVSLVRDGQVSFIIDQDLISQGSRAVQCMFDCLLRNIPVPTQNIYMPLQIHTKENPE